MIMPSIALPTGPYDWIEAGMPRSNFETRVAVLRDIIRRHGATHAVVYGNTFDHADLLWLSNFTPKLGPALMLLELEGPVRLLFSGGPGMKPSAQRLTWLQDVAALRSIRRDIAAWLEGAGDFRVGVVVGASVSHGDWLDIELASGGSVIDFSEELAAQRCGSKDELEGVRASASVLQIASIKLFGEAREGANLAHAVLKAERSAYAAGAQDVRLLVARTPWGRTASPPDEGQTIRGPLPVAMAVRVAGYWSSGAFVLGDITSCAAAVAAALKNQDAGTRYVNRVGFPAGSPGAMGLIEVSADANGAKWTGLCMRNGAEREWLFWPPGL